MYETSRWIKVFSTNCVHFLFYFQHRSGSTGSIGPGAQQKQIKILNTNIRTNPTKINHTESQKQIQVQSKSENTNPIYQINQSKLPISTANQSKFLAEHNITNPSENNQSFDSIQIAKIPLKDFTENSTYSVQHQFDLT